MYKNEKIVIEDMSVSNDCPKEMKIFTGAKSKLELPVTVSFLNKGEYKIHIDSDRAVVEKIK